MNCSEYSDTSSKIKLYAFFMTSFLLLGLSSGLLDIHLLEDFVFIVSLEFCGDFRQPVD